MDNITYKEYDMHKAPFDSIWYNNQGNYRFDNWNWKRKWLRSYQFWATTIWALLNEHKDVIYP